MGLPKMQKVVPIFLPLYSLLIFAVKTLPLSHYIWMYVSYNPNPLSLAH